MSEPRPRLCCPHDPMGYDEDTGYCGLAVMMVPPYVPPTPDRFDPPSATPTDRVGPETNG